MFGKGSKKTLGNHPAAQLSGGSSVSSFERRGGEAVSPDDARKLMLRVRQGDREAFGRLFEEFKGPIMSYLYPLVQNQASAEELTQETFLRVYRARESYEPKAKFSTWLWTIAHNAAMDHLRKRAETPASESADGESPSLIDQLESPLTDAESALVEQAERARVEHCMGELTLPQREALMLRTVSELSYDEIATTMSSTLASVKSLINRAKQSLVDCIRKGAHA